MDAGATRVHAPNLTAAVKRATAWAKKGDWHSRGTGHSTHDGPRRRRIDVSHYGRPTKRRGNDDQTKRAEASHRQTHQVRRGGVNEIRPGFEDEDPGFRAEEVAEVEPGKAEAQAGQKEGDKENIEPETEDQETPMKLDFELEPHEKTILYVVGGAGALLLAYWYLKSQGYWDQWFGATVSAPSPAPSPSPGQGASVTPQTLAPYDQAMNVMANSAASPLMTVDQWAGLWQSSPAFPGSPIGFGVPGSITPSVIAGITTSAGGQNISAAQFVQMMLQQQQNGMSSSATAGYGAAYVQ